MIEIPMEEMPFFAESLGAINKATEVIVVRDDLLEGGSKTRFLPALIGGALEIVYAGPICGGAPVALAAVCKRLGRKATIFYAQRKILHHRQQQVLDLGGRIEWVYPGYTNVTQARGRHYAATRGALFLPLGFDLQIAEDVFVWNLSALRQLGQFDEIWACTGSGMLARCLSRAFPDTKIKAVAVGLKSRWSQQAYSPNVEIIESEYRYERECKEPTPFPACPNYERKGFKILKDRGQGRVLFYNVIGN